MRSRWGRLATGLFLLAAVGFAAALLWGQWAELRRLRSEVGGFGWTLSPAWLAMALLLGVANLFWMGAAWVRLYRAAGGALSYGRGIRVWIATNLGRYIPGKIWQLSGLAVHLRRTGESGALALTSALTFQVVTLLSGTAVGVGILGRDVAMLPGGSPGAVLGILVLLAGLLHPRVVAAGTRWAARLTREEVGELEVPRGRDLAVAGAALTVAWGVYGLGLWCLVAGVSDPAPAGPALLTGIFAASYVAGYLVLLAPGGLVVREGAMTALLAALTPLGAGVAGALAVAARLWVTAAELLASGMAALPGRGGGE